MSRGNSSTVPYPVCALCGQDIKCASVIYIDALTYHPGCVAKDAEVAREREHGRITLPSGIQIDMSSVDCVNVACDRLHLRGEEQGWLTLDAADAAAIRGQHD